MPFDENRWIEGDQTVEMDVTLRLSGLSEAINSVPYSAETLLLLTRTSKIFTHSGVLLIIRPERLVMSSSPSSSSSSSLSYASSFSLNSFVTEPLSVGAIQTLPPLRMLSGGTIWKVLPTGRIPLSSRFLS